MLGDGVEDIIGIGFGVEDVTLTQLLMIRKQTATQAGNT
jgi:hypothetical protein